MWMLHRCMAHYKCYYYYWWIVILSMFWASSDCTLLQINQIQSSISSSESSVQNQEEELKRMRDELAQLRQEESQLEQKVEAGRSQLDQLARTLGDTQSQIAQVQCSTVPWCSKLALYTAQSVTVCAKSKVVVVALSIRIPLGWSEARLRQWETLEMLNDTSYWGTFMIAQSKCLFEAFLILLQK